jgi:putative CRISPR-associated protein (TIGR02619 family)
MSKTIVCSVGTSAAKGICPAAKLIDWVREHGGPEQAAPKILDRFRMIRPEGVALREELSAEIHSLVRIGLDSRDRVLLLASATDDAFVCALALREYLQAHWPGLDVQVDRVPGLQVHDALEFRRRGVLEYCRRCLQAVHDYGAEFVVLNPTGGWKALVPYTALVGMLKRVPCRYMFEQSESLLELPPLPVEFQRGLFEVYRPVFERIERESAISRTEWERNIPYSERPVLEALVEFEGDSVTLSGVGLLFLDEVRTPSQFVPFLSQRAWDDCLNNLARLRECEPFRFLDRVARSREAFRRFEHVNVGNGMRWLKPGNTTDRYLISVEEWRMLVWRAIREDEIGPNYPGEVTIDPQRDRRQYSPFTRMEFVE